MKNSTKQDPRDFDYLWDHYSVYAPEQSTKVIRKCCHTDNAVHSEGTLQNAVNLLYGKSASQRLAADYMGDAAMRGIRVGFTTVGKKSYLTDNGTTLRQLAKKNGCSREEMIRALKLVSSDHVVTVINDEICIELACAEDLASYYRNMANVITKIKLIGGNQHVRCEEKGAKKERGRKIGV